MTSGSGYKALAVAGATAVTAPLAAAGYLAGTEGSSALCYAVQVFVTAWFGAAAVAMRMATE